MFLSSPVLLGVLIITVAAVGTNGALAPADCLQEFFQQAGIPSTRIGYYLQAFRRNELDQDALFDLNFVELIRVLQPPQLNITIAGDVHTIYKCVSNRGPCVVQPFCRNSGACVFSHAAREHRCKCSADYKGATCETKVLDRLGNVEDSLLQLSTVVANVGVTYTHWGKSTCNQSRGAELVYTGRIAGQYYTHSGGASNHICLPLDPQYGAFQGGFQSQGILYGAEFETSGTMLSHLREQNPLCSVCHVSGKGSQVMIPAYKTCPPSWTLQYHGYLMTAHYAHAGRTEYICVDSSPDVAPGEGADSNGALLYFVEAACGRGLACPPFDQNKELTCAVCSR